MHVAGGTSDTALAEAVQEAAVKRFMALPAIQDQVERAQADARAEKVDTAVKRVVELLLGRHDPKLLRGGKLENEDALVGEAKASLPQYLSMVEDVERAGRVRHPLAGAVLQALAQVLARHGSSDGANQGAHLRGDSGGGLELLSARRRARARWRRTHSR